MGISVIGAKALPALTNFTFFSGHYALTNSFESDESHVIDSQRGTSTTRDEGDWIMDEGRGLGRLTSGSSMFQKQNVAGGEGSSGSSMKISI